MMTIQKIRLRRSVYGPSGYYRILTLNLVSQKKETTMESLGRLQGSEFQASGFRVFGFRVYGLGFRVKGLGCRLSGSGLRVQGSRVQGSRL